MRNTRIKLTWYGVVILSTIAIVGLILKLETVIITAIPSIAGLILGYQGSRAITKKHEIE